MGVSESCQLFLFLTLEPITRSMRLFEERHSYKVRKRKELWRARNHYACSSLSIFFYLSLPFSLFLPLFHPPLSLSLSLSLFIPFSLSLSLSLPLVAALKYRFDDEIKREGCYWRVLNYICGRVCEKGRLTLSFVKFVTCRFQFSLTLIGSRSIVFISLRLLHFFSSSFDWFLIKDWQ